MDTPDAAPPIAALFVVQFDQRVGYQIAWSRSTDLDIAGVEYKALPSGLHSVEDDLIYFIHGEHAGVSAFKRTQGSTAQRGAQMAAAGVLVPLSYGRLGRSWRHAESVKSLARSFLQGETTGLDTYWDTHQLRDGSGDAPLPGSPSGSPVSVRKPRVSGATRGRSASDGVATTLALAGQSQTLSSSHPALSLPGMLNRFGPLLFPLYRAALLRRRILFLTSAPVHLANDYVYIISILSNLPRSIHAATSVPPRLRPLFTVGVHDIDFLESLDAEEGWAACTTDSVLATKHHLFDVLVTLADERWPMIQAGEMTVKATQRDVRRYRTLTAGLTPDTPNTPDTDTEDDPPLSSDQVESASWSAVVVTSLFWWASAGEQGEDILEETEADEALLEGLVGGSRHRRRSSGLFPPSPGPAPTLGSQGHGQVPEMATIAYFHRYTASLLGILGDLCGEEVGGDGDEDDGEDGGDGDPLVQPDTDDVTVTSDDVLRMGLDSWSERDRHFVAQLALAYFDRNVDVQAGNVDCCGVKVF